MKKLFNLILLVTTSLLLLSCEKEKYPGAYPYDDVIFYNEYEPYEKAVTEKDSIPIVYLNINGWNQELYPIELWVDNEEIATINQSCYLIGKKEGTVTVYAKVMGVNGLLEDSIKYTVKDYLKELIKENHYHLRELGFDRNIDEIDAVGRQRGTGLGGGHDEREQTLNQLLTEMDGFGANEGIIIIAATNRPDVLDPALLRPGRFDRQVTVNLPDVKGREEILGVHAKNKTLAEGITLKNLAKRTPGFSGADLENLLNEAALLAVRRDKDEITMSEIDEATDRVLMGPAKVSHKYSENDRKLVAYHEAGHAVIGLKLANANVVQKVTIIPRGSAGGYNMMVPKEEKLCSTKTDLLDQITGLLGGRTAEEITFGEITTGAHNDFEKATKIARSMVTEYGMSDLGPLQFEQQAGSVFLGRDYNKSQHFSNEVAHEIDMEMRRIVNDCHKKATEIIKKNKDLLKLIAETLLEYETLTKEQIEYLVEHGEMPVEDEENLESLSINKKRVMVRRKAKDVIDNYYSVIDEFYK